MGIFVYFFPRNLKEIVIKSGENAKIENVTKLGAKKESLTEASKVDEEETIRDLSSPLFSTHPTHLLVNQMPQDAMMTSTMGERIQIVATFDEAPSAYTLAVI